MRHERAYLRAVLAGAVVALSVAGASAAPVSAPRPKAFVLLRGEAVAAFFNRTPAEVDGLRQSGYGYGEIVKILVVAELSRRPIPALVERNRKGYGWGAISRESGLHPAVVKKRVDMAREALGIKVRPAPAKTAPAKTAPKKSP